MPAALASALVAGTPRLSEAQVSPAARPRVEIAGSFALEFVASKSWAHGVGARVAVAPWAARGLSLEFDASWTLGSAPLDPKAKHGSPTIASAQASYYASGDRVQPFVSAGISVTWSSLNRPFNGPSDRPAATTMNLGAGMRVRLTRGLSVRPEFRWYAPHPTAIYRMSLAFGYGW